MCSESHRENAVGYGNVEESVSTWPLKSGTVTSHRSNKRLSKIVMLFDLAFLPANKTPEVLIN